MMGNLFYSKVPISEIKSMEFWEMKYWNEWYELMEKERLKAVKNNGK